jgi:hypothetical protein
LQREFDRLRAFTKKRLPSSDVAPWVKIIGISIKQSLAWARLILRSESGNALKSWCRLNVRKGINNLWRSVRLLWNFCNSSVNISINQVEYLDFSCMQDYGWTTENGNMPFDLFHMAGPRDARSYFLCTKAIPLVKVLIKSEKWNI